MTIVQFLAGIAAHSLYRLQSITGGRCGGFGLYHHLWQAYTANYRISRTGYILRDMRTQKERTI